MRLQATDFSDILRLGRSIVLPTVSSYLELGNVDRWNSGIALSPRPSCFTCSESLSARGGAQNSRGRTFKRDSRRTEAREGKEDMIGREITR